MGRARSGPAPPASRVLRIADATGLRPALDPGASTTPWASQTRAGTGPAPGRRTTHLQDQKDRKITTSEVSTVSGDCQVARSIVVTRPLNTTASTTSFGAERKISWR